MPDYRLQIVQHGSHVYYGGETYATKATARDCMRHYVVRNFPGATVKAAGSPDAVLVVQDGAVTHTVSVELAEDARAIRAAVDAGTGPGRDEGMRTRARNRVNGHNGTGGRLWAKR